MPTKSRQLSSSFIVTNDSSAEADVTVLSHNKLHFADTTFDLSSGDLSVNATLTQTSTTGPQQTIQYDSSNKMETTVDISGNATIASTGDISINTAGGDNDFNSNVTITEGNLVIKPTGTVSTNLDPLGTPSITVYSEDTRPGFAITESSSSANAPDGIQHVIAKSRGTSGAPTAVNAFDFLLEEHVTLHQGTALQYSGVKFYEASPTGPIDGIGHPCQFVLNTTANGSVAQTGRISVSEDGVTFLNSDEANETRTVNNPTITGLDGSPSSLVQISQCGRMVCCFVSAISGTQAVGGPAVITIDLSAELPALATPAPGITTSGPIYDDNGTAGVAILYLPTTRILNITTAAFGSFGGAAYSSSEFCFNYIAA